MLLGQVPGRRLVRQRFVMLFAIVACLGLLAPSMVAAQSDLATPVDPAPTEDADFGAQAVVHARFDQSATSMVSGGSIEITLTVTATATADVAGTIDIPGGGDVEYALIDTQHTENMTACDAEITPQRSIAGSYTIAAGTGTCGISFTVTVPSQAPGEYGVFASIMENGEEASTASTKFDIVTSSVTTRFAKPRLALYRGESIRSSLIIDLDGPIADGTLSVSVVDESAGLTLAIVSVTPTNFSDAGTCTAAVDTDHFSINGTFSEPTSVVNASCVIEFDLTAASDTIVGEFDVAGLVEAAPFYSVQAATVVSTIAPETSSISFIPPNYVIPQDGTSQGSVKVTYPQTTSEIVVTVSSDVASIHDPGFFDGTGAIDACTAEEDGDTVIVRVAAQVPTNGSCIIWFSISINPDQETGDFSIAAASTSPAMQASAPLTVSVPQSGGISGGFDMESYQMLADGTFSFIYTVTIAEGSVVDDGLAAIPMLPDPEFPIVFTGVTVSGGDGVDSTCTDESVLLPTTDPPDFSELMAKLAFTSTGAAAATCSIQVNAGGFPGYLLEDQMGLAHLNATVTARDGADTFASQALVYRYSPPEMDIELTPATAAPGEIVTVTIYQTERISFFLIKAYIIGNIPPGTRYIEGSASLTCFNSCDEVEVIENPNSIQGLSRQLSLNFFGVTIYALQYQVEVTASPGQVLEFYATGRTSIEDETTGGPVRLTVREGAVPTASDFTLVVEAGGTVSGSLENHVGQGILDPVYTNESPTGDGSLDLDSATGAFTYTAGSSPGSDTIAYTVTDGTDREDSGTITVTVIDPLDTNDVSSDVQAGTTFTFDLNEAVDGGQAPHTFTEVDQDLDHGSVTIDATGLLTYIADADGDGTDTFSYDLIDGLGLPQADFVSSAVGSGTITITVWQPLSIAPVTLTVDPGATVTLDLAEFVTGGLPPFTYTLLQQPAQGSASIDPTTGQLSFTANADASGSDTFTFIVSFTDGTTDISAAADVTGTVAVTYAQAPTATATTPTYPTSTATTDPDVTATATSTTDPDATATATSTTDLDATATATSITDADATATATSTTDPDATVTAIVDPDAMATAMADDDGVTQLPSAGSGRSTQSPFAVLALVVVTLLVLSRTVRRRLTR